jgi:hypothetical protein
MLRFRGFLAVTRTGAKAEIHAVLYTHTRTTPTPHSATRSHGEHYLLTAKPSAVTTYLA